MAYPTYRGTATTIGAYDLVGDPTSGSVSLFTGAVAGDLLLLVFDGNYVGAGSNAFTLAADGWTVLSDQTHVVRPAVSPRFERKRFVVWWKWATSGDLGVASISGVSTDYLNGGVTMWQLVGFPFSNVLAAPQLPVLAETTPGGPSSLVSWTPTGTVTTTRDGSTFAVASKPAAAGGANGFGVQVSRTYSGEAIVVGSRDLSTPGTVSMPTLNANRFGAAITAFALYPTPDPPLVTRRRRGLGLVR